MKRQLHRAILFSSCLLALPSLTISQERAGSEPKTTQTGAESAADAESAAKELASLEQALEQSCRHMATIHRAMAAPSESDSASTRETKQEYARLAEDEEKAAAAADKLAVYHTRLAATIHNSSEAPGHRSVSGDSAYRK